MPTQEENIQYLYLVLTQGGLPQIDWAPICAELSLGQGAVSKRWSRLKQAMDAGKPAGPSAYSFLWLLVKHSTRDKVLDWKLIAEKCGTTPGAASKRYSRMKQAFESGAPPTTPKKTANGTPKKTADATPAETPKRKRAPPKKNASKTSPDDKFKPDPDADASDDEYTEGKKKRARTTPAKPRASKATIKRDPDSPTPVRNGDLPTPARSFTNPTEATTFIKSEPFGECGGGYGIVEADEGEDYFDAEEYPESGVQASEHGSGSGVDVGMAANCV